MASPNPSLLRMGLITRVSHGDLLIDPLQNVVCGNGPEDIEIEIIEDEAK